ncbi:MAG TPA: radical SAM protein, partial [Bacteroidales bacterium]|nr:radical SAM protein [Bacteroidales bacterium]
MDCTVLLITPPFTQLNTPYPATAYLKGFLNTRNIRSYQVDLGIEVILDLFSSRGLEELFSKAAIHEHQFSENSARIFDLKDDYIQTIDLVVNFLQGRNPTLAHLICEGSFLPEASRFEQAEDLEWAFGTMGMMDKAKHLATLYMEDISDFIVETTDPHFGFSRYAERLGRSANSFDDLNEALNQPPSLIDTLLANRLKEKIESLRPQLVGISVPFPGNLFYAFKCGQWIKENYPEIKIALGGGFANTELRSLKDPRVFDYVDFIMLDDGEAPLMHLIQYIKNERILENLKRTYCRIDGNVVFINGSDEKDIAQRDTGTPDYSDLLLDKYISVIEVTNPMHRLWSDGRWNKITLAHGCYWGRCTFCDTSLDYIKRFEPVTINLLCDRIEEIAGKTMQTGFHFVDEAAPPALLKSLSIEIIRRNIKISWWANIRFEKNFTADLCRLLKQAGCIAVSGGLEVASDKILRMINKGVNVTQVAKVCDNFTQAGIMVHAYLMYGFPTQSVQETVDSLEVVRQLFMNGLIQSGFWHQFALTAHSPIGL